MIKMQGEDIGEGGHSEDTIGYYCGRRNEDNERHGRGWAILPNGDYYNGCYFRGLRNGKGLYVFMKNGCRYDGEWRKGQKYGVGIMYYPDGSRYEGDWRHDLRHGFGGYFYPNNDIYEGAWFKGRKHGLGTYFYAADQIKYMGTWIDDVLQGPGQVAFPRFRYHGTWYKGVPKGTGTFVFDTNCMLHGYYEIIDSLSLVKDVGMDEETERELENIEEEQKEEVDNEMKGKISAWRARNVTKYLAELMPDPAVPLPVVDSLPSVIVDCVDDDLMEFDPPSSTQSEEEMNDDTWLRDRKEFVDDSAKQSDVGIEIADDVS